MDPLAHEPFAYVVTKDAQVRISFGGRVVTVVAGREAARLVAADRPGIQQILARATGNFKRGNERRG